MTENKSDYILGVGAGGAGYYTTRSLGKNVNKKIFEQFTKAFSLKENVIIKKLMYDGFEKSGLKEKGIEIIHVDITNMKSALEEFRRYKKSIIKSRKGRSIPHGTSEIQGCLNLKKRFEKVFIATANGMNAFFHPLTKRIYINSNRLPFASFHEMGHAVNRYGGNKLLKTLSIARHPLALLPFVFLSVGLFKNKKPEGEKPEGFGDKTTTYIKNNAGKLSLFALLPRIVEEGLASINGAKIAKEVLSPEMLKKLNKTNFLAWTTYVVGTLAISLGIALGIKIRDKIIHNDNTTKENIKNNTPDDKGKE